jgi:hypothetical protein
MILQAEAARLCGVKLTRLYERAAKSAIAARFNELGAYN